MQRNLKNGLSANLLHIFQFFSLNRIVVSLRTYISNFIWDIAYIHGKNWTACDSPFY